jgi:hypothetical protein
MYYPKSQVTTGLFTNGREFVIKDTGGSYQGPYWKNSAGQFFTGASPSSQQSQELVEAVGVDSNVQDLLPIDGSSPTYITEDGAAYVQLNKSIANPTPDLPVGTTVPPTQKDYTIGEYRRYFCKKVNQETYLEISQATYSKLVGKNSSILWQYYIAFDMPWTLTGDMKQVYIANRNITEITSKKNNALNLAQFLKKDYLKYYRG